jgi:hypothetical protein
MNRLPGYGTPLANNAKDFPAQLVIDERVAWDLANTTAGLIDRTQINPTSVLGNKEKVAIRTYYSTVLKSAKVNGAGSNIIAVAQSHFDFCRS